MTSDFELSRRETLVGAAAFGLTLAAGPLLAAPAPAPAAPPAPAPNPAPPPAAQQGPGPARGTVFEDKDGTGKPGPANPGIEGILVSNGMDVVKTDAEGRWSLPVAEGDSLFVIKPTGWVTPIDPDTNLPRFAYIYAPNGTPEPDRYRFPGVPASGPLPPSIDFPLRRREEPTRFNVLMLTDPQPESLAEVGYVRDDIIARAAAVDAAFGITHGDVMFDDLSFYDRFNRIIGAIGMPWYNCCGNHDMNLEAADNKFSRETFKQVFGTRYAAFQYGGVTFFILDNVEYQGTDPARPNGFGKYQGKFGGRQLSFIRNVLANVAKDSLIAFSFHIPLKTLQGDEPSFANTDTRGFLEVISTHPNTVSFAGHTHTNEHWYFGANEGYAPGEHHHHVLTAASGSWWSGPFDERGIPVAIQTDGSPNGFKILAVDGNKFTVSMVPAHERESGQMRIMLDAQLHRDAPEVMKEYPAGSLLRGPIAKSMAGSARMMVNFFDGGPKSQVEMAIGKGGFIAMKKVEKKDPFVVELYARNEKSTKPWVKPDNCSHLWELPLPRDIAAGTQRVRVRATDDYGRTFTDSMVLEITA